MNVFVPLCEDIKKFAYGGRWLRDNFINSPHVLIRIIFFALDLQNQLPQTQELQFLMEQVELIHNIDELEKKRKKKRER